MTEFLMTKTARIQMRKNHISTICEICRKRIRVGQRFWRCSNQKSRPLHHSKCVDASRI